MPRLVRTQVQLTGDQIEALKRLSLRKKKSLAGLVRQSVDHYLRTEAETGRAHEVERALKGLGKFASGSSDISVHHDDGLRRHVGAFCGA